MSSKNFGPAVEYQFHGMKNVAVDLDKTLLRTNWKRWREEGMGYFGMPKPGAISFLKTLRKKGYHIIIHTCRVNPKANPGYTVDQLANITAAALRLRGLVFDEIWVDRGKPVAKWYIDDSGVQFKDNFTDILLEHFTQ